MAILDRSGRDGGDSPGNGIVGADLGHERHRRGGTDLARGRGRCALCHATTSLVEVRTNNRLCWTCAAFVSAETFLGGEDIEEYSGAVIRIAE